MDKSLYNKFNQQAFNQFSLMATGGITSQAACDVHSSLKLEWVFGVNRTKAGAVHNLSTPMQPAIFYCVGHTGILYDANAHTQTLLRGHTHAIISSAVSDNRRFIVTVDESPDPQVIVWDAKTARALQTIKPGHGEIAAVAISHDASYVATLSKNVPQTLALYEWTTDEADVPIAVATVPEAAVQATIAFRPEDPHTLLTCGPRRVVFWQWSDDKPDVEFFSPPLRQRDFKQSVGAFTDATFVGGSMIAVSGTVDGDVVLWSALNARDATAVTIRDFQATKAVRCHNTAITAITTVAGLIVTGGHDGLVRMFDSQLRIVAWFEEMGAGPIASLSFQHIPSRAADVLARAIAEDVAGQGTALGALPDFVVSTAGAMIVAVSARSFATGPPEAQRGRLLVQGHDQAIAAVATHPSLPRVAIGGYNGQLHIWDYNLRKVLMLTVFRGLLIQTIMYDSSAQFLAVGFTNGVLKILDPKNLEELQSLRPARDAIRQIAWSHDGKHIATADAERCVSLFRYTHRQEDPRKPIEFVFVGRHVAHRLPIVSVTFGTQVRRARRGEGGADGADPKEREKDKAGPSTGGRDKGGQEESVPRLFSLGEDNRLVEYSVAASSIEAGLRLRTVHKLLMDAVPTAMCWLRPGSLANVQWLDMRGGRPLASNKDLLVIAFNNFKIKIVGTDPARQCHRTILAPLCGGALSSIMPIRGQQALAFTAYDRIVGLVKMPLDGDPVSSVGAIAHPIEVASAAVSHDGRFMFSAGGTDGSVAQWAVDASHVTGDDGRPKLDHFVDLLDGGRDGQFMKDVVDYFYYAQVRSQGEATTARRTITGKVPMTQVANLMRALGHYPSEREVAQIIFELVQQYAGGNLKEAVSLDFATFVQTFVNHRPMLGISAAAIATSFKVLGAEAVSQRVDRDALFNLLASRGEKLSGPELAGCLRALLGDSVAKVELLDGTFTAESFAERVLGFDDFATAGT